MLWIWLRVTSLASSAPVPSYPGSVTSANIISGKRGLNAFSVILTRVPSVGRIFSGAFWVDAVMCPDSCPDSSSQRFFNTKTFCASFAFGLMSFFAYTLILSSNTDTISVTFWCSGSSAPGLQPA